MFRTWLMVVGVLVGMVLGAGRVSAMIVCQHCGPYGGCDAGGGFMFCFSGKAGDNPFCLAFGGCGGGGSDDGGLMRPRQRGAQPAGTSTGAADDAGGGAPASGDVLLALYSMRMPIRAGFDPFPAGSNSFVVRGVSGARTASGMLAAIATRAHVRAERIPLCEESTALGPGVFAGAFTASDGDGYVLRATSAHGATRVRLCTLRARRAAGTLADASLREDDVLFVRVRGSGREYALVLTPWVTSLADVARAESARADRAAFDIEAGPLTARMPDDGVRFLPSEAPDGDCR